MTIRKNFKGCTIDNSMLKANMCLPTLTNRLKTKLPRSEREKYGFKLENYKEDENIFVLRFSLPFYLAFFAALY